MIGQNLKIIEEKIAKKCIFCGKNRADVRLIAVSKTHPIADIQDALKYGIRDFGENKAQELRDKAETLKDNFYWHFIGHLQSNKVKYVVKSAEFIHSVDSAQILQEIQEKAAINSKSQKVLLEVKTSNEDTKFGIENYDSLIKLTDFASNLPNVNVVGLMTMAPYTDNEEIIRDCFKKLFEYKMMLNDAGLNLKELSMGMTNDYEIAIEEGATMIRIGSAIFGERNYKGGI